MRNFLLLAKIACLVLLTIGATPRIVKTPTIQNKELKFLDLKFKKELSDKKLSAQKKYVIAILAARELRQLHYSDKALEYYKIAKDIKTDENKTEVMLALSKNPELPTSNVFFYDVNLKTLIKNKSYEKALLSINPESLNDPRNAKYKIVYDLLNVKVKKRSVKKLFCFDSFQKDPDDYQYSNLLCDTLVDYLREGKVGNDHIKLIEEYFFKTI